MILQFLDDHDDNSEDCDDVAWPGFAWLGLLMDGESSLEGLGNNNKIVSPASFYLGQALDWVSLRLCRVL